MERLSGLDAAFLYLETPAAHMHVTGVMVLDPSTLDGGYSFDWVLDQIERRLVAQPEFRRRVVRVPFDLARPVWVEDPDFDLRRHVKRIAAPTPGGVEELAEVANEIVSIPLDRSKPLWELWVVEGLEHGHVGLVAKMHHATIDGVSGANLLVHLFDLDPEADDPPRPELPEPERIPSELELVAYALRSRVGSPFRVVRTLRETGQSVLNVARQRRRSGGLGMAAPFSGPRTPFNRAISARRSVAFASVPLGEVKAVKDSLGVTVNDVVLEVCGGALLRHLDDLGARPEKPLVAVNPVSVRGDEPAEGANQVSAMFTSLATDIEDPVDRVHRIHESTRAAKEEHQAVGAGFLQNWAQFSGPNIGLATRLYSRMRLAERHAPIHNLVVSNVPGPPFPLHIGGAKLVGLNPLGPIFDGAGLNITVLSYVDEVGFGLLACPESVPDLWKLAGYLTDAFEELEKAAEAVTGPRT